MSTLQQSGWWHRFTHWVSGRRAPRLKEEEGRVSFISLLLMLTQSAALALVVGHLELSWLISGAPAMRVVAVISLFILVAAVISADSCALKSMRRMPILSRNHATAMLAEHTAYVLFVVGVEAVTYGLAIWVLEENATLFLSDKPLLPQNIWTMLGVIAARVLLVAWTYLQAQIIAHPLPPQWETMLSRSKEMIGGHGTEILKGLELQNTDMGAVFEAFAAVAKPPRRRPTWWNGWLRQHDEAYEQELDHQRREVVAALRNLSGRTDQGAQAALATMQAEVATLRERLETAQLSVETEAGQRLVTALLQVATSGTLPGWVTEQYPQLAEMQWPALNGKGGRIGGAKRGANREPTNRTAAQRALLQELGITPCTTPAKKRGVWLNRSGIETLSGGIITGEAATKLARIIGDSTQVGTGYAAPFEAIMTELSQRHILVEAARLWWESSPFSSYNAGGLSGTTDGAEPDVEPVAVNASGRQAPSFIHLMPRESQGH